MQLSTIKNAVLAMSLFSGATAYAQQAQTVLYTANGFEASAGYVSGLSLAGQSVTAPVADRWAAYVSPGAAPSTAVPLAGVATYAGTPAANNTQYVAMQGTNIAGDSFGFFYPQRYSTTPYVPVVGSETKSVISVAFSMAILDGYAGNAFMGVTAFNSDGREIGSIGVDGTTGQLVLPNNSTVGTPFTSAFNTFYNYKIELDYNLNAVRLYTAPNSSLAYTLNATAPFASVSTNFSDADFTMYSIGTNASSGYALFDNYVVTVPEPTGMAVVGLACGLLSVRRRRTI